MDDYSYSTNVSGGSDIGWNNILFTAIALSRQTISPVYLFSTRLFSQQTPNLLHENGWDCGSWQQANM